MKWTRKITHCVLTDVGMRRQNNEDAAVVQLCSGESEWESTGHMFLVADGMGGHAVGELASKIASETVPLAYQKNRGVDRAEALESALFTANETIHARGNENPEFERMGTTCSALVLSAHGALIGHVGDSRVYRVRKRRIEQLTFDHSLQWETRGPDSEQIMPRNVITRCLGPEAEVHPDIEGPFRVRSGDRYVLCSDGLTGHVNDSEIGAIVTNLPCADATQMLINLANLRGGSDNCTVVVTSLGQIDSSQAESDPAIDQIRPRTSFFSLISGFGFLLAGLLLLAGVGLLFVPVDIIPRIHVSVSNSVLAILAGSIVGVLTLIARNLRPQAPPESEPSPTTTPRKKTSTIFQQDRPDPPYRKASAQLTTDMLDTLHQQLDEATSSPIVSELEVDWDTFNESRSRALAMKGEGNLRESLAASAQGLHVLMLAVADRRREIDVATRWGESAPTP